MQMKASRYLRIRQCWSTGSLDNPTDAVIASSIAIKDHAMASHKLVTESTLKPNGFAETEDEETAAISVIDAADLNWGGPSTGGGHAGGRFGSHFGNHPLEGEAPPPGYVCRICHIPRHFIQHCPSKSKPPPPGYICYKCGVPGHFIQCCPKYGDRKYDYGRTSSLTPVVSSFDGKVPTKLVQGMSSSTCDSLPAELHCPLCKKVMTDAMLTSKCCYDSFCDKCIRGYIISQLKCICGAKILIDDLIPNQTLRSTIVSMLSSRGAGFSIGTGHTSSSSSNLDDKSNNFTASAALKRDMKQHMDIMPSVVTECSRQVTACKNPADPCEKSAHSDLQRKTGQSATTSVKKTITTADSLGSVPKPRYQNQQPPDGVTVVSGALERKVIRTKAKRKQKTAGKTGSGNTICAEYDFQVPFDPSCYNSFEFGGPTWGCDPYNMYFMLNMPSSSYPMGLYNDNVFSNLPLHAPGMQGYPASHYRELRPTLYRDRKASAHARQAESSKGNGTQPHKSERYTLTSEGGRSRSKSRSSLERRDSSFESHDCDDEFHSWKRARLTRSPKNADNSRSRKSRSRHSYRKHAYEDST